MICALLLLMLSCSALAGSYSRSRPCESEWTFNRDTMSCYKVIRNLSVDKGERVCKQMGSHLASIHSQEESEFLSEIIPGNAGIIGLHKMGTSWFWLDGSKIDYLRWAHNEPNNANIGEDCTMMYTSGNKKLQWNDVPCTTVFPILMCKKSIH